MINQAIKNTFTEKVLNVVAHIPKGSVLAYGQVAKEVGSPRAARAVGTIMKANFNPDVPCHRVVRSDGHIGNYNRGGTIAKIKRLQAEGVSFNSRNRVLI